VKLFPALGGRERGEMMKVAFPVFLIVLTILPFAALAEYDTFDDLAKA
jgi:hypothetical protein